MLEEYLETIYKNYLTLKKLSRKDTNANEYYDITQR